MKRSILVAASLAILGPFQGWKSWSNAVNVDQLIFSSCLAHAHVSTLAASLFSGGRLTARWARRSHFPVSRIPVGLTLSRRTA